MQEPGKGNNNNIWYKIQHILHFYYSMSEKILDTIYIIYEIECGEEILDIFLSTAQLTDYVERS